MAIECTDTALIEYKNDKWNNLKINVGYVFESRSSAITITQDYMIRIGGQNNKTKKTEDVIFVYDLINGAIHKSDIKAPTINLSAAITTRNNHHEDCATFGCINKWYKATEFKSVQELPMYLKKLIREWVCFEKIHLIELDLEKCDHIHWVMDVDKIIESIFT